jgi:hypothetical protein
MMRDSRYDQARSKVVRRRDFDALAPHVPDLEYRYHSLLQALADLPQAASPVASNERLPRELQEVLERVRTLRRQDGESVN